jgi:hypothetical protein
MDFWNDNTTFLTHKKKEMWIQKICQSIVIFFQKNKTSSNEELISEMHWNFPNIYILNFKF